MTITDVKFPETIEESKQYFESKGYKTIPIKFDGLAKKPHPSFTHAKLESGDYEYSTDGIEAIAMVHGEVSGTFAIDVDFKNKSHSVEEAIKVLFNDVQKTCDNTLVIKTPKQGVHFIFESEDGVYPAQKKYHSKQYPDVEIDIRSTHGYTLIPPSTHPEKQFGKYGFVSNTLIPAKMKWSQVKLVLAERGFFTEDDIDDNSTYSNYDISQLLTGKFKRSQRRRSENSLYCKLRIIKKTVEEASATVRKINRKLDEPLDDKEVDSNLKYAEAYYQNRIVPGLDKKSNQKEEKRGWYVSASQLMDEYNFISHVSGEIYYYSKGIYHPFGDLLIKKKSRQYWESIGIESKHITEIVNIIKDKTMILSDDMNQEIFDTEYKKIIVKNGMYDFDKMEFVDHTSDVLALVKHPIYYDETKTCPKFEKFLDSCFDGDIKRITQIWEMMALCLIKKYIIQKGYVNYGIGSNGKTTFLSFLRNMIGIGYTSSIPMQQFQDKSFIGYEIRAKCANLSGDGGIEPITKTGFIKGVLGGDAVRCEQKFRSPFDFLPYITMIFTFNELPVIHDSSEGFARKIQTIEWGKRFYGKDRDLEVDKLPYDSDERSGVFNKLIPIIKKLIDTRQLSYESTVQETKEVWLARSDSFFKFKNDSISLNPIYRISVNKLKEAYHTFCVDNGMTVLRDGVFFNKIKELLHGDKPHVTRIEGESIRTWFGITTDSELREDIQKPIN